ncbi:hypothetical protein M8A51_05300 [Schlegelella sp. S2-27]|uniref:Uncharacterized protein n=1 Tax=Caldimonas mangrovi TaxID=2944811 RepID=A0ABT0YKK9_9BURK|nr:hypothetical protein [Caldimonas mangrovi]MCM5678944.1 hypothetical protein [Caldimonas mangrovi]
MAVIRLQVEIDSAVYPELYAGLYAIERPQAREERLRQLAASGLLWEGVRMRGSAGAVTHPQPPATASVPVLFDVVDDGTRGSHAATEPPLPPALEAGVYRPGARSERVKRMRDRGLFKNG